MSADVRVTRAGVPARGSADLWAGWQVGGAEGCPPADSAAAACGKDDLKRALHLCRAIKLAIVFYSNGLSHEN